MNWTKEQKKLINKIIDTAYSLDDYEVLRELKRENGLLETTPEVGKVYYIDGRLVFVKDACSEYYSGYGFDLDGSWHNITRWPYAKSKEATEDEWFEALSKEADRRGYREGIYKCLSSGYSICANYGISYLLARFDEFWDVGRIGGYTIMKDGIWAEIIDEKTDKIEAIQNQINELQKQLNELRCTD